MSAAPLNSNRPFSHAINPPANGSTGVPTTQAPTAELFSAENHSAAAPNPDAAHNTATVTESTGLFDAGGGTGNDNLSRANLSGANLSQVDLRGADLHRDAIRMQQRDGVTHSAMITAYGNAGIIEDQTTADGQTLIGVRSVYNETLRLFANGVTHKP